MATELVWSCLWPPSLAGPRLAAGQGLPQRWFAVASTLHPLCWSAPPSYFHHPPFLAGPLGRALRAALIAMIFGLLRTLRPLFLSLPALGLHPSPSAVPRGRATLSVGLRPRCQSAPAFCLHLLLSTSQDGQPLVSVCARCVGLRLPSSDFLFRPSPDSEARSPLLSICTHLSAGHVSAGVCTCLRPISSSVPRQAAGGWQSSVSVVLAVLVCACLLLFPTHPSHRATASRKCQAPACTAFDERPGPSRSTGRATRSGPARTNKGLRRRRLVDSYLNVLSKLSVRLPDLCTGWGLSLGRPFSFVVLDISISLVHYMSTPV